jgi:ABC-type transport system involved in multi-copper enzyme maturation permease subunit
MWGFKNAMKLYWKEQKEHIRDPWFWILFVIMLVAAGYFHFWEWIGMK